MRMLLQRVASASVSVGGKEISRIQKGLLILCGFRPLDSAERCAALLAKAANLRIFEDKQGKMNLSVIDVEGQLLLVSQFTLYADTKKSGRRPSFSGAMGFEEARGLYESLFTAAEKLGIPAKGGSYGEDMLVSLVNDGPVTILLDNDD